MPCGKSPPVWAARSRAIRSIPASSPIIKPGNGDAIPDAWKSTHNIPLSDATAAAGDYDHDGYTNIEKFLNSLAGDDQRPH
jgi:hypothetical protein